MDSEDRDHFKTIAGASAGQSTAGSSRKDSSASRLDPDSSLKSAKLIAGCYRRDEAQNPELFADALALVLGDYPADIVRVAVDPRTGVIEKFPMGLPNVGQIKQFLDDLVAKREKLQRYEQLPKFQPYRPEPVKLGPNLFVPASVRRYDEMAARAHAEPALARFDDERNGVWVPLGWWEAAPDNANALQMAARAASFFDTHERAEGVTIGGQPVSRELAGKLGVGNGYSAEADTAA